MSDDGTPINGAVALVTGGHRGFGRATIDELLGRGAAKVYATSRTATWLLGRRSERAALDGLVAAVRAGGSRALVVQGEPGVGKSALLDYVAGQAAGCRVVRATGVESEMELAFAGLHQLCAPLLGLLGRLPVPQGDALATAFGLRTGEAPDRFLVSLAVLSLFGEAAEERPLVCLVDDAQWLDRASAQVLGFVARRLVAESVGLIFVSRQPSEDSELKDLRELVVEGLPYGDARVLLESVVAGPMDDRVRDRIIAETAGNPLALVELPRGRNPAELAGGFGLPSPGPGVCPRRAELRPSREADARGDATAPADCGGRADGRSDAPLPGGRADGPGRRGGPAGCRRSPHGERRCALSPSSRALRCLPCRFGGGPAAGACRARRVHGARGG